MLRSDKIALSLSDSTASPRAEYVGQFAHTSLQPVKAYVQRPALCDRIREQLHDAASQGEGQYTTMLVVWGLGGAGKTQLVLDYLRRHRNEYKATFWIEAGSKGSIERDFIHMYQLLFDIRISAGQDMVQADDAVLAVKSWFSGGRDRWLLVFDGADAIENEEDDDYVDLQHYIPDSQFLHVIVTTRSRTAKEISSQEGVEVGEMTDLEAVDLFHKSSQIRHYGQETEDEIKDIVKELGHFALAINLAGTYVAKTPRLMSDLKQYLPEYHQRRRELLSRKPEKLIHQYGESVLTTWETSFLAIHHHCPEACRLLTLIAFLSFDDIFLELLGLHMKEGEVEVRDRNERDTSWTIILSAETTVDQYKIEEYFDILQTYSLVQWKDDQQSYSMHKLVHAWGYERLGPVDQYEYSITGLQLLQGAISMCRKEPQDKLRLVPHMMANFGTVTRASGGRETGIEDIIEQVERIGEFMHDIGRWAEAYEVQKHTVKEWSRLRGQEHLSTISAMNNLAATLGNQGQLEEAAAMNKEVLEKRRRILGEEHPSTISAMNNLAATLRDQGQLEEAAAMTKEALEKRRRILGEEHPDTILAMNNLANTLGDQGQLEEAAAMKKEVLEKMKRILGEEHPSTILAMNNLAATLGDQGQLEEAAAMNKEVLEKRRRILGEEHPDTISAMYNLAATLGDQGQLEEAAAMKKEVLEKRRRILGEEHPDTRSAAKNLGILASMRNA